MKPSLAVAAPAAVLVLLALAPIGAQPPSNEKFHRHGHRAIPNHYIVVLDRDVMIGESGKAQNDRDIADLLPSWAGTVTRRFDSALNGFAAFMTEQQAEALAADSRVAFVEEDSIVETMTTQNNPPWGLDRISQRDLPLNHVYTYTTTGAGVNAYIIDTGIRRTHTQFGGRARVGLDAIGDGQNTNDCNGHGTHVSGIVGGSTYGVAKSVRLFAVRVLDCSGSGSTAGVIAGVDWVTANHIAPAVANLSLGGPASTALDTAVRTSILSGVTYAVAAGNSNTNASTQSPARVSEAITVGSTTINDARSSFSNFGSVVDIFAPGSSIVSAFNTSDTATATLSGTSMATPQVTGIAARILQATPTASPAAVRNQIVSDATTNRLNGIPTGTSNRLLFRSGSK